MRVTAHTHYHRTCRRTRQLQADSWYTTGLFYYGVPCKTLSWIQSFLADRTQQVTLKGQASSISGEPQGKVLGSLLFLVYINDLLSRVKATACSFADDCFLYRIINLPEDAQALQDDLDALQHWEKDWLMLFNPDKCEVIRITKMRKHIDTNYTIHGKELGNTKNVKYLGVLINDTLSWNTHVDTDTKKTNNTTVFLQKLVQLSSIYQGHLLQDIRQAPNGICSNCLGPAHGHPQGTAVTRGHQS